MELRQFRYFVAVADELHFGRAAVRLGISQPPLSQQIRRLEEELGVDLFERTSRRVRLTDVGEVFLPEARGAIQSAERAVSVAHRAQRGELGELAIGFTTSGPFTPLISKALFEFRQAYPAVHLDLAELSRSAQVSRLVEQTLDAAFLRGGELAVLPPSLVATSLFEESLLVAMRSDHPLATVRKSLRIADLAEEAFVLYDRTLGAGFNEHLTRLCHDAGFEPRVVQEAGGLATLLGLVAAGFGLTVLSQSLTALHLDNVVYRELDEPEAVTRLWLVHRAEMSPSCRRFVEIVLSLPG